MSDDIQRSEKIRAGAQSLLENSMRGATLPPPTVMHTTQIVAAALTSGILATSPTHPSVEKAADLFEEMLAELKRRKAPADGK